MTPENVTGPVAVHAEAPVWWPGWGSLRWVDGDAGDLLTLRGDEIVRQHIDDEYLAFFRPRTAGGFVAVGARTLYLADGPDAEARPVATLLDDDAAGAMAVRRACPEVDSDLAAMKLEEGALALRHAGHQGQNRCASQNTDLHIWFPPS